MSVAGVAHPVERHLAKVEVASSSLVARSKKKKTSQMAGFFLFGKEVRLEPFKCKSPVDSCLVGMAPPTPYEVSAGHRGTEPRHPSNLTISCFHRKKTSPSGLVFLFYFSDVSCYFSGAKTFPRTRELK